MKYDILLLDADETLMDFPDAEHQALVRTFDEHGLSFDEQVDQLYQSINQGLWRQLERGEITKDQLLAARFARLFEALHIEGIDSDEFNRKYLYNLGFGSRTMPDALETCRALHQLGCRLYVLTNGVSATQRRRLGASGLMPYLSDIFVSEEAGQPKPALAYFQYVFERIPEFEPSRALMVGDSLSSDMEGARRAGLDACWFNAKGLINEKGIPIRYEIAALPELIGIVEG